MSRNCRNEYIKIQIHVAPREGRVSRNYVIECQGKFTSVAPREGRVSRNSGLRTSAD